ncbi:hypothetical protein BDK92_3074 [Micromonospora pisi]|uniref:Uncharacterized protein n=1 Tax=Micromonospora pisi TaxID=589240 RepID=A0A495JK21_9ACTN|nr:hypothetical protein [Micromonospora pisi]RKR88744.1 hypothetical protein BDK92_3074 [Micromonospora pisi]
MSAWAVVISDERYESERLFHHDTLEFAGLDGRHRPASGDPVLVLRDGADPLLVALGRIATSGADPARKPDDPLGADEAGALTVAYTRRVFDSPAEVDGLSLDGPLTPVDPETYRALADRVGPAPSRSTWLVSLDLPIEAATPAEAVALFWSYVRELGPRELPAFVSPAGNELAMQAFVLGAEANQDPEEDDD